VRGSFGWRKGMGGAARVSIEGATPVRRDRPEASRSRRVGQVRRRAIASISTRPPFGSAPTAKVERAGGRSGMNRA